MKIPASFPAVGRCIYCFRTAAEAGSELTKEHIIAKSLDGFTTLPEASCSECAAKTSQIERAFARGPAWPLRTALMYSSRRKDRPTQFPLIVTRAAQPKTVFLNATEYPVVLPMPVFAAMPPIVSDQPSAAGCEKLVVVSLAQSPASELLEQLRIRLRADSLEFPPLDVTNFARMIVKSAYALAVAQLGLQRVGRASIVSSIVNDSDIYQYIGSGFHSPLQPEAARHITQVQECTSQAEGRLIVVMLKLFADMPTPGYVVAFPPGD